jgi:tetratricopeptide (TPR) repeat protein
MNLGLAGAASDYAKAVIEQAVDANPDLLIVFSGHNEFLHRPVARSGSALIQLLELFYRRVASNRFMPTHRAWMRDSEAYASKLAAYGANMEGIAELAIAAKLPLIVGTLPSNLADWAPVYRDLDGGYFGAEYTSQIARLYEEFEAGGVDSVRNSLDTLAKRYPNDSSLDYIAGRLRLDSGDFETATELLRAAKDRDPMPWRALSEFNETVRQLASRPGVYLADADRALARFAGDEPVGYRLIADNAHPTPLGSALIAGELLRVMQENRIFVDQATEIRDPEQSLDHFMSSAIPAEAVVRLYKRYFFKLGKYSMKPPFYNYAASRMYFERVLELDAKDWRAWANLGSLSLLTGELDSGKRELIRAKRLRGRSLDPENRGATPYLKEALERAGLKASEI